MSSLRRNSVALLQALAIAFALTLSPGHHATATEEKLRVFAELDNYESDFFGEDPARIFVVAVLKEAGYEAEVNLVPWTRLVQSLDSQANVLGFHMTRTPERENNYHWIGMLRPVSFKLWGLSEHADELPRTLDEARNLRIRATRDDVVADYLTSIGFTNLVYLSENSNTITMLRRGRIDLMPYIEEGMEDYLLRQNESPDTLTPLIDLDEISTGHYLVMSKNSDEQLVGQLQNAFQRLVDRGELERIMTATEQQ